MIPRVRNQIYDGQQDVDGVRLVLQEAGHVEYVLKVEFQSR